MLLLRCNFYYFGESVVPVVVPAPSNCLAGWLSVMLGSYTSHSVEFFPPLHSGNVAFAHVARNKPY